MKINVTPIERKATEIEANIIESYGLDAMYVFHSSDGEQHSVKFFRKELDDFRSSKTVSEVMQSWEENINRRYREACNAIESGLHPFNMINVYSDPDYLGNTEVIGEEPAKIGEYETEFFTNIIEKFKPKLGKIIFYKIVL